MAVAAETAELVLARRFRRAIHRRPELGNCETRTALYVERLLTRMGLRPFRPSPTSVAVHVGPKGVRPAVGFRADLDALPIEETTGAPYASKMPGIMHACGHDGHTAALLLLARRLAADPPRSSGVLLVFQQGEEVHPSGAPEVLRGLAAHLIPHRFFALHLWPELPPGVIGIREGPLLASVAAVTLRVTGKAGRAHGTDAETGGTDAIAAGVHLYSALSGGGSGRRLDDQHPYVLSIGRFDGGDLPNRLPVRCELRGTLRALGWSDQDLAAEDIRGTADAVAARTGTDIEVVIQPGIRPPVENSAGAVRRVVEACQAMSLRWRPYPNRVLGVSDDFGWYLKGREGAMILLGCGEGDDPPDLHTPVFDFDEGVLLGAVDLFEALARRR